MQYFKDSEFACKCGCSGNIKPELLEKLHRAREIAGVPFVITSGYRCKEHNAKIGGSPTSSHLKGLAVDIRISNQNDGKILKALYCAGFNRVGIDENSFIHVDIDSDKATDSLWFY